MIDVRTPWLSRLGMHRVAALLLSLLVVVLPGVAPRAHAQCVNTQRQVLFASDGSSGNRSTGGAEKCTVSRFSKDFVGFGIFRDPFVGQILA